MSDFDREAERERLREKYERDKAKREASERMSELLLQGATMTNRHCPECQSPVFRYEGTEFCPTCQQEVRGEEAADAPDADGNGAETDDSSSAEEPSSTGDAGDASVDAGGEATADGTTVDDAAAERGDADTETATDPGTDVDDIDDPADGTGETQPAPARERRPARIDPPARREESPGSGEGGTRRGGLDEAEAALVREVATLTRRAADTRDVGRKRDLLAAAREAAETLETVRRL